MSAEFALNQAVSLHKNGRLTEAEPLYRQVLSTHAGHPQAHYLLALLYYQQNRAPEALQAVKTALKHSPDSVEALLLEGVLLQGLRRLGEALQSFDKALLLNARLPDALYNRGVVLLDLNRFAEAARSFDEMLALRPDSFEAWNNLGVALQGLNRLPEALKSYDRCLAVHPAYVQAWNNRSGVLQSLKRPDEAIAGYDKVLAIESGNVKAWTSRGEVFLKLRRFEEALSSFEKASAIAPDAPEILNLRASTLQALNRFDEALTCSDRAMTINRDDPSTLFTRAVLLCEIRRIDEGIALYARRAELVYGARPVAGSDDPPHKQRHDAEQVSYLAEHESPGKSGFRIVGGERSPTAAVNAVGAGAIDSQWQNSRPRIVVIDNFLTEDVLEKLRRFCWGSTIWRKAYKNGYLGAAPEAGFACPLLAQIAEDMLKTFPAIFQDYGLIMLWAFKYDSNLSGTRIHADQAAVNVNFWITPDDANCNSENGGLVIWDASAPSDWEIAKYNGDEDAARAFLASAGARPTKVPYRANRAVIFDSDLFHETDVIDFKDGYLNRRINITMLFGRRNLHGT